MLAIQEENRKRISRELHDVAGQELEALKLNLIFSRKPSRKIAPSPRFIK
jgi:signal transduction histidine kinase